LSIYLFYFFFIFFLLSNSRSNKKYSAMLSSSAVGFLYDLNRSVKRKRKHKTRQKYSNNMACFTYYN